MEFLAQITEILKIMAVQASGLYNWLNTPIFTWQEVSYTPLYVATPSVLIIILTYNIIRWLTVW